MLPAVHGIASPVARWSLTSAVMLLTTIWVAGTLSASALPPIFKIYVEDDGAYRVVFEELGLEDVDIESDSLQLTVGGAPVPIWVGDGGDSTFGSGDWFEFLGEGLRGEVSHSSEYSRFNVYFLRFDGSGPARMRVGQTVSTEGKRARLRTRHHFEEDLLLLRLKPRREVEEEELWYWAKLASLGQEPFTHELDLSDLEESAEGEVSLSVHLRGWSQPRKKADSEMADHRVNVRLNGSEIAGAEWNSTDPYLLEIPSMRASSFEAGPNILSLEVPKRTLGEAGEELVDVVMLNWIEVDYPRRPSSADLQAAFRLDEHASASEFRFASEVDGTLLVYGDRGSRWLAWEKPGRKRAGRWEAWAPQPGERSFVASLSDRLNPPSAIVSDRPSHLTAASNRADYIIIAHPRLIDAARPLAEFHRSRGLAVELVDIEDVYDEFNHGVLHPRAIRDFLDHAYHNWQKPAPRFVLFVGDASWDAKNPTTVDANYADWTYRPGERLRFVKNGSTPYPTNAELNHRGLIPTWNHGTYEGHAASDNFFVAIDGDDFLPDMAIGRLPVVEPAEATAIVDKTIRYVLAPQPGAWRRRALFITNESLGLQRQSNRLARIVAGLGLTAEKIYPASSEISNEHHSEKLLQLFDEGQLLVHFLGHGGRYIWRTGPPDLNKNHDLFTLDHLDQLEPTDRLPVVLSLTCYSAPFDHPRADSIGEKFLRADGRGAIAVVAASWRNNPLPHWGEQLLEKLAAPGATIGEAVQQAKRDVGNRIFVETYNLLGDPAVPVATPKAVIALEVADEQGPFLSVSGTIDLQAFSGSLVLDLVGKEGEVLVSSEIEIETPAFELHLDRPATEVQAVRAYAWNAEAGLDATGGLALVTEEPQPARRKRGRAIERPATEDTGNR